MLIHAHVQTYANFSALSLSYCLYYLHASTATIPLRRRISFVCVIWWCRFRRGKMATRPVCRQIPISACHIHRICIFTTWPNGPACRNSVTFTHAWSARRCSPRRTASKSTHGVRITARSHTPANYATRLSVMKLVWVNTGMFNMNFIPKAFLKHFPNVCLCICVKI